MKFQIASDLHIEFKNDQVPDPLTLITPVEDILILSGDIGNLYKIEQLQSFLTKLCSYFHIVLYVPGNSEYYKVLGYKPESMSTLFGKLLNIEKSIHNLYILNNSSVRFDDICIIGTTLWSKPLVNIPKFIVRIEGMTTNLYKQKHYNDLQYINHMITYCKQHNLKLFVVTHYCPTYSVITNRKKNDKYISLYASHLDYLLDKDKIHTWLCGHIHINFDLITSKGTHLIGNQLGKPKDKIINYKKDCFVEI